MNQSAFFPQRTDADGAAFTGNLRRASLLAHELATRRPPSQQARDAAAGTGGYPQPGGAIIYQRGDGGRALGNLTHMGRAIHPDGWRWPATVAMALLLTAGLVLATADDNIVSMLRKLF